MRERLARWWNQQRRAGALPGIVGGALMGPLIAVLMLGSSARHHQAARQFTLSPQAKADIDAWATEAAPQATLFAYFARLQARNFAQTHTDDLDESEILAFSAWANRWSDRFGAQYTLLLGRLASTGDQALAPAYARARVREIAGSSVPSEPFAPLCVGSRFVRFLSAPAVHLPPGGQTPEEAMSKAIQHLLTVLANLPPNSNGAKGIRNAIIALRNAAIPFDTTPPVVSISNPSPNAIITADFNFSGSASDTLSPLQPASVSLIAASSSQSITLTSYLAQSFDPVLNTMTVSGTIPFTQLPVGEIDLTLSISNGSGLTGSATVHVAVGAIDPILADILAAQQFAEWLGPPALGIEIVGGNSQSGVTSTVLAQPLSVRVFNTAMPSMPVPNIQVAFHVSSGTGKFPTGQTLRTLTNDMGVAEARYVLGPMPGTEQITAVIPQVVEPTFIQFTVTAIQGVFEDITQPSPCNSVSSVAEFAGSALPRVFKMRLKKPNGAPLGGYLVQPKIHAFNGTPVGEDSGLGYFVPRRGVTKSDGTIGFAFVISPSTAPGSLTLRFEAPAFLDSSFEPLKVDVSAGVLAEAGPESGRLAKIYPADPGQGQVGVANQSLGKPFRIVDLTGEDASAAAFIILEGHGEFQGVIFETLTDACGNPVSSIMYSGVGSITFKPTSSDFPMLIGVKPTNPEIQAVFDIFAVGPPECDFVTKADSPHRIDFLPTSEDPTAGDTQFLIEARLPVNFGGGVSANLTSRDSGGTVIDLPDGLGAASLNDVGLEAVSGQQEVDGRFAKFRLPAGVPLAATTKLLVTGEPVPSLGAVQALQMVEGGLVTLEMSASGQVFKQPQAGELRIERTHLVPENGTEVVFGIPEAGAGDVTWTLETVSGSVTGGPLKNAKRKVMLVDFNKDNQDLDAVGSKTAPIRIKIARDHTNRRVKLRLKAKPAGNPEITVEFLVSAGTSRNLDGATAPPDTDSALNDSVAFYFSNEPSGQNPEQNKFIPVTQEIRTRFSELMGTNNLGNEYQVAGQTRKLRLLYTADPPANMIQRLSRAYGLTFGSPSIKKKDGLNEFQVEMYPPYGTAITGRAKLDLDAGDMAVITAHEKRHCEVQLSIGDPGQTPLVERVLLNLANQFFTLPEANRTNANRDRIRSTANEIANKLDEIEQYVQDLSSPDASSFLLAASSAPGVAKFWSELLNILENGSPVAGITLQIQDVGADKVRTDLIQRLQTLHDGLPEVFKRMKGGTWKLKSKKKNEPSAIDLKILKPSDD